jgi:hypothetical protein
MADDTRDKVVDAGDLHTPTEPVDPEVQEEFDEAEQLGRSGARILRQKLREHPETSPEVTAGDLDAAWDRPDVGEESPGGSVATPDQDIVEDVGKALGLTFEDNEAVDPRKLEKRDKERWELDPASSEDYQERVARESGPKKKKR